MKKLALLVVLLVLALPAWAEKKWQIVPDSPEEKALLEVQGESDAAKRVTMLDAFTQKFAASPALPATQRLYCQAYVDQQQWDKAIETCEKAADADNEDFNVVMNLVRAAQAKSDFPRVLKWSAAAMPMYDKASKADTKDLDEDDLKKRKEALKNTIVFLEYATWDAALRDTSADKAKYVDAFVQWFPQSEHAKEVPALYALYYAQQNDVPKTIEWGEKAMAARPDDERVLLTMGEVYYAQKTRLADALNAAQHLLEVMKTKTKSEGMADADWQKYVAGYEGSAHSIKGRALMQQDKTGAAIPELLEARKLLESTGNQAAVGPVLFNLGFAYAKEKKYGEAKPVLEEAVKIGGPFAAPSADILKKIRAAEGGARRR